MEGIKAHERVMSILITQIFNRQLKPGDKLPTEREMAKEMKVDRVSLKIGLKHMEMMNLLTIRQGDGIYVLDYLKGAGIDFLRILFLQSDQSDGELLADPYVMDELGEFWVIVFPEFLKLAVKRFTPRVIKTLMDIFDEELANLHDRAYLLELELKSQDLIAEVANNIGVILLSHSCRPIRKKILGVFIASLDDELLKNHIETKKYLIQLYMSSPVENILPLVEQYGTLLKEHHLSLRKILFPNPDIAQPKIINHSKEGY
jgi:DNA-binding FadR family transcriptional regulator